MNSEDTKATPRAMIGEIPVYCAYDEIIDIGEAVPNPKNPNYHPHSQVNLLAKIIKSQGWRNPITISKRSGLIVKGHGRLLAALELGSDQVPVEYQEYRTEAEEIADLTADNRLSELSEMDDDALTEILQDLNDEDFPIELAGYTADEFDELLGGMTTMDDDIDDPEEEEEKLVDGKAQPGYVFWLGGHRLICGNGSDPKDIESLKYVDAMVNLWEDLSGEKAVLLDIAQDEDAGGE